MRGLTFVAVTALAVVSAPSFAGDRNVAPAQIDDSAATAPEGDKILGSALNDWVFTPITACRALDTRPGSLIQGDGDGPLAPGTPYEFSVVGGGICGVPSSAKAVFVNYIAVGAAGNGNLRVWPWDSSSPPQPGTAVITYTFGFNTSNGVISPICNTQTSTGASCVQDLFAQTNNSSSHVVADLVGYFAAPATSGLVRASAHINGGATPTVSRQFNNLSASAITVTRLAAGTWEVNFGADVSTRFYSAVCGNASVSHSSCEMGVTPRSSNPNALVITTEDSAGTLVDGLNFFITVF